METLVMNRVAAVLLVVAMLGLSGCATWGEPHVADFSPARVQVEASPGYPPLPAPAGVRERARRKADQVCRVEYGLRAGPMYEGTRCLKHDSLAGCISEIWIANFPCRED